MGDVTGSGFTVIVNDCGVPVYVMPALVYDGVTVIVATTGTEPVLTALNDPILPEPAAANPIDGVSFVQL